MMKNLAVIILAAGKGTRMKSETPKVMHPLCGRPMLKFSLDLVKKIRSQRAVAVLGYKHQEVSKIIPTGVGIVVQKKLLGSADAVKVAGKALSGFKGTVLILYGDNPLLKEETIKKLLKHHNDNDLDATLLTAEVGKPFSYYFGACWDRSGDFTNHVQWEEYVRRFAERRDAPLRVTMGK